MYSFTINKEILFNQSNRIEKDSVAIIYSNKSRFIDSERARNPEADGAPANEAEGHAQGVPV